MHNIRYTLMILLGVLLHSNSLWALPFHSGETQHYVLKWKNGALTIKAGYLKTEVVSKTANRMRVQATATSTNVVDAFYPIRYTVQSVMEHSPSTLPQSLQFDLHGREKNEYKDQIETFDLQSQTGQLSLQINKKDRDQTTKKKQENRTYSLTEPVQDVLSMLYLVRSAPLPVHRGGTLSFKTVYEGELWNSTFKLVGSDTVRVAGSKVPALIYQMVNVNSKGEKNEATRLWLAQDPRKTLVKVESEVQVGKIQLLLRDTDGAED
jgi:hypothetical protein